MTDESPPTDGDPSGAPSASEGIPPGIRSIKDLIDRVTGRHLGPISAEGDSGLAEQWPYPFLALVGQMEMKLGLLLALVNPAIGGVLLIGPRGTGKTTAVRSLIDLLPSVRQSKCHYGCTEEDAETGGIEALCPNCAEKYAKGEPLSSLRPVRLVELPLNARLEDVVGSVDERAAVHNRMRIRRGILSHADRNLLYVDEVNLLGDEVVDAILDAAAQGSFTVRRGAVTATYRSRFTLVGTMNPEEGRLRPQILDRFGLRLLVRGLEAQDERLEAYRRARAYITNPKQVVAAFVEETILARDEIEAARALLPQVTLPDEVAKIGLDLIRGLGIDSLRAEITLFEAARALAAADARSKATPDDIRQVAPMALRLRRSAFMDQYFDDQRGEEAEIAGALAALPSGPPAVAPPKKKSVPRKKQAKKG
ncbi:MAG: ATP-binding protein [Chloroflexi bacterium]|nr:ATP-binding protein [Chloroflexota bacterium]